MVVAYEILVSAQGPLVLDLELRGLGIRVWGQGLTIMIFITITTDKLEWLVFDDILH